MIYRFDNKITMIKIARSRSNIHRESWDSVYIWVSLLSTRGSLRTVRTVVTGW